MKNLPHLLLGMFTAATLHLPPVVAQNSIPYSNDEQSSINVYRSAAPAVVTIRAGRGSGSGSFITSDGLILTNEHVIQSSNNGQVQVSTQNGRKFNGVVIATDRTNDLALVRVIAPERFPVVKFADPSSIQVGQRVFAIGAPFGLSGTLTTGILSRIAPNGDLQTDAALNPGNSGGPLLNSRGELIGVNKAIFVNGSIGNTSIGFATSAPAARSFIAQNRNRTTPNPIARQSSPRLGVTVDSQTLVIQDIASGSLASKVGLRTGDQILAINDRRVRDIQELIRFLDSRPPAAVITIARNRRLGRVLVQF